MSNSLDPDQARRFVGPDLGLNCLQRLSADDTSFKAHELVHIHCIVLCKNNIHYLLFSRSAGKQNTKLHKAVKTTSLNMLRFLFKPVRSPWL